MLYLTKYRFKTCSLFSLTEKTRKKKSKQNNYILMYHFILKLQLILRCDNHQSRAEKCLEYVWLHNFCKSFLEVSSPLAGMPSFNSGSQGIFFFIPLSLLTCCSILLEYRRCLFLEEPINLHVFIWGYCMRCKYFQNLKIQTSFFPFIFSIFCGTGCVRCMSPTMRAGCRAGNSRTVLRPGSVVLVQAVLGWETV